jgi:hypothetical protein
MATANRNGSFSATVSRCCCDVNIVRAVEKKRDRLLTHDERARQGKDMFRALFFIVDKSRVNELEQRSNVFTRALLRFFDDFEVFSSFETLRTVQRTYTQQTDTMKLEWKGIWKTDAAISPHSVLLFNICGRLLSIGP